ncbi:MAG: nitrate reductase cytochrome c-type subunit [Rhizobiales bacterium]|nr:nitrate reductase cytochrome c-type subunit [Hyphomicrobiales bacterium]
MRTLMTGLGLLIVTTLVAVAADTTITTMRKAPLAENPPAPRMMPQSNSDLRQVRNYPEQPPLIPHKTDGYQVDLRSNKCLTCHSRKAVGESQAPMVSITHFMDRDGQFLASVSPRRYFCNQCHVSQHESKPWVGNTFVDVDTLLQKKQ